MKFVFVDRDGDETYTGWKYPDVDSPMEFSSLEEFVEWTIEVGLPRHSFLPPMSGKGLRRNDTPYWMVYCNSDYD